MTDTNTDSAKGKKAKWELDHSAGISAMYLPGADEPSASYPLTDLPGIDWAAITTETGRMVVFYGHKQKLSDSVARRTGEKLTDQERLDVMQLVHQRLVEDRWNAARMTADDLAAIRLRQCKDESEMQLLARLQIVTTEHVAKELLRREAE